MLKQKFLEVWQTRLFVTSLLILGVPLTGSIPMPSGQSRESITLSAPAEIIVDKMFTSIVWGVIYGLAFFSIFISSKVFLRKIKSNFELFLILGLVFLSAFWSPYPGRNFLDGFQLFGSLAVCLVAAQRYEHDIPLLLKHITIALGVNLLLNMIFILAIPSLTKHPDGRWAGITGNANYLGNMAFCCLWASLAWLAQDAKKKKLIPLSVLTIALITLMGCDSVTSILSSAVVIVLFVRMYFLNFTRQRSMNITMFYLLAFVGFLIILFLGTSYWFNLLGRDTNLTGRNFIWLAAIDLIQIKPLFGHGFSSDTETLGVLSWATTFHNGYLDVGVKLGLIGLFLFIYMVLKFLWKISIQNKNRHDKKVMGIFLIGYLFYNFAETGILMARNPVWIIFLIILLTNSRPLKHLKEKPYGFMPRQIV